MVSQVETIAGSGFGDTDPARGWVAHAWLLEAAARDALGETAAAEDALEHALGLAESGGVLVPFLFHRAPELLERHARHCPAHAALISRILTLLTQGPGPVRHGGPAILPLSMAKMAQMTKAFPDREFSGIGGVSTFDHALNYFLLGCGTVQVCTSATSLQRDS